MILFPAVDIQNGKAVRLKQGRAHESTVFAEDPTDAAKAWEALGAQWLHVVDLDGAFDGAAKSREIVRRTRKVFRRFQQRLGRDATHIGAGAARSSAARSVLPLVDTGDVETQLCSADGGNVATRATANDDDIKLLAHVKTLKTGHLHC